MGSALIGILKIIRKVYLRTATKERVDGFGWTREFGAGVTKRNHPIENRSGAVNRKDRRVRRTRSSKARWYRVDLTVVVHR
ncbi:MAG: hypothetical protein M1136_02010 [Chloroflexi bacterium]|nr:hypothetical protein [Chloroflexota bacterium]